MTQSSDHDWQPDPQLLAAYFDGELETRDEMGDLRRRIEAWLVTHPEAAEEADALDKLWLDTTPAEPGERAWTGMLDRIESQRAQVARPAARRPWLAIGLSAACVLLAVGALLGVWRGLTSTQGTRDVVVQLSPDELEMLQVALAGEITILRYEGADTDAVVVGAMPVDGDLALADTGEVCISCKCPRVVVRQDPPHRPMVYARADLD